MSVLIPTTAVEPVPSAPPAEVGYEEYQELPLPSTLREGQLLFRILGAASIHVGTRVEIGAASERMFSLLCVCALSPEHTVPRARLLELVWPDMTESAARHSLRQHCYRLKQLGVSVHATRTSVTLSPDSLAPCFALHRTAEQFDRDVLKGSEPFGHLFGGWIPRHAALRQWVEQQRDAYHGEVRRILVPELRRLRDRAHWMECERWARTLLEFDPYNEDATLILAHALAMTGSRRSSAEVLDAYVRETGGSGTELGRRVEREQARILKSSRVVHEQSATPRLIGRDDVLARLDDLTMRAMQGDAQIVQLVGPAGIGKTEVAYEATRRAVILGFARCVVRVSRPVGQIAHGTLSRLTRDLLQLPGALGCTPANLRLLRQFAGLEPAPRLGEQPDGPTADPLTECLLELMSSIAEERPLFVFVDDLHYVDRLSSQLLPHLFDRFLHESILVLLTDRRGIESPIPPNGPVAGGFTQVALQPLSLPESAELASLITTPTGTSLDREVALAVAERSDRSPLQVIALARESLSRGISESVPSGLKSTLLRQLARLSDTARVALQCVALLGGTASPAEIESFLGLTIVDRIAALRELLHSGLIDESEKGSLSCHDEVGAAALAMLAQSERELLHRQVATQLAASLSKAPSAEAALSAMRMTSAAGMHHEFVELCTRHARRVANSGMVVGMLRMLEIAASVATDPNDKEALLRELANTACMATDWRLALESTKNLRRIRAGQKSRDPIIELAELEAKLRSDLVETGREHAAVTLEYARDEAIPVDLRLRAVGLVVSSASDLFAADLAIGAFDLLTQLHGEVPALASPHIEPFLQYHTIFGDLPLAVRIAESMNELISLPHLDGRQSRLLGNSCYVLRVGGRPELASERLQALYTHGSVAENPGRRAFAAWQLALLAADRLDIDGATAWTHQLEQIAGSELDAGDEYWVQLHRLRIELLCTGDISGNRSAADHIRRQETRPSRALLYSCALALRSSALAQDLREYTRVTDISVQLLADFGRYAGQDLLAGSVAFALERLGEHTHAETIATQYVLRDRRELTPPLHSFSHCSSRIRSAVVDAFSARNDH